MMLRLVNPPEVPGYTSDRDKAGGLGTMLPVGRHRSLPNLPPLDLLYSAGIAERAGIKVEIIDALGERLSTEGVLKRLGEVFGPLSNAEDAIGVRLALPSLEEDLELARTIRARFPRNRVFLFGSVLKSLKEKALIPGVDLFCGEAEALILPYLRGETLPTEWAIVEDLDALPFPAWHLLPLQNYAPKGRIASGVFALSTSRGCPRACPMCPYAQLQGRQWRFQSPERVLAELDWLFRLGIRTVQTRDPNIGINRARLVALAEGLIRRPYRMRLVMETDLETLDEELLRKLSAAGLVRILTGIESADPDCLKDINQDLKALNRSIENATLCEGLGIEVLGFLVFGNHSESFNTVLATVTLAKNLPVRYSTSLMTPYPGTYTKREIEGEGRLYEPKSFHQYGGTSCLIRSRNLTREELMLAYRWAQEELEIVNRERLLAKKKGVRKLWSTLGKQAAALRHLPTTWRFQQCHVMHSLSMARKT